MKEMVNWYFLAYFLGALTGPAFLMPTALAESANEAVSEKASIGSQTADLPTSADKPKKKKRREQKETEGSEAPGRFEAETILKSRYQLNGEQLEVDPD